MFNIHSDPRQTPREETWKDWFAQGVSVNVEQVRKVAELLKSLPENGYGLNFYSFIKNGEEVVACDMYPPLNCPQAVNFFFFVCMHQYGFWRGDDRGYLKPLTGRVYSQSFKGSDLIWRVAKRAFDSDEYIFEPAVLMSMTPEVLSRKVFYDDNGPILFPDLEMRFRLTRAYGRWFAARQISPAQMVEVANATDAPLRTFLMSLKIVPGFDGDNLEKKNLLLAMILANRSEKFLNAKDSENWRPIVDYHLMRTALRLGLVDLGAGLYKDNAERRWACREAEGAIRMAVYDAIQTLIKLSGRPMSYVNEKMWMARRYCPEMERPDCAKCVFESVCKKRVELFQPVFRTTAY